jgi:hypothetical protein
MTKEERERQKVRLIAKAWTDEGFRRRLLSDPGATLKDEGVDLPAGREVRVLEDTDKVVHYVLPAKPKELELSDDLLDQVAGGLVAGGGSAGSRPLDPGPFETNQSRFANPRMGGSGDELADIFKGLGTGRGVEEVLKDFNHQGC